MAYQFRYSRWDGTQQVFDFNADLVFDLLNDELIEHGDLNAALRRVLKQGIEVDGLRLEGIQQILREIREHRQNQLEEYRLENIYDEMTNALDEVLEKERTLLSDLQNKPSNDVQVLETSPSGVEDRLDFLNFLTHEDLVSRIRGLKDYDFLSDQAAQDFNELIERIHGHFANQIVDEMAGGIRQTQNETISSRMKDMLAELNEMFEKHRVGESPDLTDFMENYGDFFPENPEDFGELLEAIAKRMVAVTQILNSLSSEQRIQLEELAKEVLDDIDLQWQMDQLSKNLQTLFPDMSWELSREFTGEESLNFLDALSVFQDLADIDRLEKTLTQVATPGALAEIDIEKVKDLLGERTAEDLRRLSEIADLFQKAGFVEMKEGQLELTPRAIRRLGQNALRELYQRLSKEQVGQHESFREGAGHERDFATRPYEFGDPFNLNIGRTLRNALMRNGFGIPVELDPADFEVDQTEAMVRAATVLMLDLSLSMPMRGNFVPAKKVAMALHTLMSSQFPKDYFGVVTFSESAREILPERLPNVSWDYVYGTNMHHGLLLARRMLTSQIGTKQIIMVTDGEPTAHIADDGHPLFSYPPTKETVDRTLLEVQRCTREDIRINVFMLDATPYLVRFVETVTQMNGGKAFFATNENLGDYLLVDFMNNRRTVRSVS